MKTLALLGLLLLPLQEQPLPESYEIAPPRAYERWYAEAASCAGLKGDFSEVIWRIVPGRGWYDASVAGTIWGLWDFPHTIYLASAYANYPWLVKHESMHDLRQIGGHPVPPFGGCEYAGPDLKPLD